MQLRNGYLTANSEHLNGVDINDAVGGRPVTEFIAIGSRLERCSFRGMELEDFSAGEDVPVSEYLDCVFDGAQIAQLSGRARFERCSFRDVRLRNVRGNSISMVDCVFSGVVQDAVFCGRDLFFDAAENEFTGNDFSGAELTAVEFRFGVDLSRQTLPSGPDYVYVSDLRTAIAFARDRISALPDATERDTLLEYVEIYASEAGHGQRQVLLRRGDATASVRTRVLNLFEQAA